MVWRCEGIDVVRIGLGPTPMLYYAAATLGVDGGIMVTGSHNPPDYNGFKFVLGGKPFFGAANPRARPDRARAWPTRTARAAVSRTTRSATTMSSGSRAIMTATRPLTVAWDAGNGATGEVVQQLTAQLPGTHVLSTTTIDGNFPAHHPDPTEPENLVQLQEAVARERCDLGIAFDGDGDRIGVVDARGASCGATSSWSCWRATCSPGNPGAPIIADVKASQVLFDEIARMGGRPVMWRPATR